MTTLHPASDARAAIKPKRPQPLRGVNLGNWLLLERWMNPSLFGSAPAGDEYTLCQHLGADAERVLRRHRETYVTADDFRWLRERGIDTIRLPVGYWIVEPDGPFVGGIDVLDQAMAWASEHGLGVVLDLHGLPGFQGPEHHSGRGGFFRWHLEERYRRRSLDLVESLAQRYAGQPALVAIGPANEPEPTIPCEMLVDYFAGCRERIRRNLSAEEVAVVVPAYPENMMERYHGCLGDAHDVWTDVHLYLSFVDWSDRDVFDYLAENVKRRRGMRAYLDRGPVIVGEWSLGLPKNFQQELREQPAVRLDAVMRAYGGMQVCAFEEYTGWFFWSYKTETMPQWSFRDSVERGWLPHRFA